MAWEHALAKPGERRDDLISAAAERLIDARVLHDHGRFVAAIMMCVYCLEIALKVQICKRLDLEALPRAFQFHDVQGLLVSGGLSRAIEQAPNILNRLDKIQGEYGDLSRLRYGHDPKYDQSKSEELLDWLTDPDPSLGVLAWLSGQS
jgi:hypothetical protein